MNYQHFGHQHLLIPLQPDQHECKEIMDCQACGRLIAEPFHGCPSCKYHLHDRCLNKPRSLEHPSHSPHPLTLLPFPTYPNGSFSCNACGLNGTDVFSYSCAHCEFDLHMHCASLPAGVLLEVHPHELKLTFDSPCKEENDVFECDMCGRTVSRSCWFYYCADCDFGSHLECANFDEKAEELNPNQAASLEEEEGDFQSQVNEMMEKQFTMMRMQNQLNRTRMMAQLMTWAYRPQ